MILFSVLLIIIFLGYGVIMYSIDNRGQGVVNSTVVLSLPVEPFWLMLADRPGKIIPLCPHLVFGPYCSHHCNQACSLFVTFPIFITSFVSFCSCCFTSSSFVNIDDSIEERKKIWIDLGYKK